MMITQHPTDCRVRRSVENQEPMTMDDSLARNKALLRILEDMVAASERAEAWVSKDSDLDPESSRLMTDMNKGDRDSIEMIVVWLKGLTVDLPITVSSPNGGRTWNLSIDDAGKANLESSDQDMLSAMAYMLFDGPEPGPDNDMANKLLGQGLPDRLKRDIAGS